MIRIAHAPIRSLAPDEMQLLPGKERERAFSSGTRRNQFHSGRWLLRTMLREHGDSASAERDIVIGEHGKPRFENGSAFSIAHAGKRVVCCVGDAGPVGIDFEPADSGRNVAGIADRFFSADESKWLSTQPAEHFFMLWVLKEAWVKAHGLSIFGHLDEPGFRVDPPLIETTDSGDVDQQALFELDGAFLAIAAAEALPAGLQVEQWDAASRSFVADESARLVART